MKTTSKERLKKPVIPAKVAPYHDTGAGSEESFKKSVIPAEPAPACLKPGAGIQSLKNRGKSIADWTPALLQSMKQCALFCDRLSNLSFLHLVLFVSALSPIAAIAAEASTKTEAKTLDRLFYTPEQRLQIDRMKNRPGQAGTALGNTISINGIVQRKGGGGEGSVVWINGVPQSRESADGLLAGRDIAPDAASVKVPGASKVVRLKVGQTLDLNSGAVRNINVAPVAGKDTPTEKERARAAEQADSPAQQPAQASKDKAVSPYGKTE